MATIFRPETPLEHAVHAADYADTLNQLRALPREQRSLHAASARRMRKLVDDARWKSSDDTYCGWGVPPLDAHRECAFAVTVVCGTAHDVSQGYHRQSDILALCQEFRPDSLDGMAQALLASSPHTIITVQHLLVAGLIPRPDSEEYTIGLISLPATRRFDEIWQADPGLREVLLQVMDAEGTSEFSLAAVDKYLADDLCWSTLLRRLADAGAYTREQLMERTLTALERDWPQFRAGWFSRFHALLEPDLALLTANAHRYLGLCHSRIPPTVALALEMIKRLEPTRAIDDATLIDALQPVLHASAKGQVLAALKLLDGRIKRTPALASLAAEHATVALAHPSADVQGQVLQRLTRWGCDSALLTPYLEGIAAVHADALRSLSGGAADTAPARTSAPLHTLSRGTGAISPLDPARRLQPPDDADALVACIAHVFENDCDTDAFEVAASALVQASPFDATLRARLGPVLKRAANVRTPVAAELARLLLALFHATPRQRERDAYQLRHLAGAEACLSERTDTWIALALLGKHLPPLSAASHQNGWIAPAVLSDRLAHHAAAGVAVDERELARARLRLCAARTESAPAPGHTWRVHSWTTTAQEKVYQHHGLELALSPPCQEDGTGWMTALRHSAPPHVYMSHGFLQTPWFAGGEECMIRFSAALLPNHLETHFADGAQTIGNNLDWCGAQWGDKAYLERLLDPTVAMGRMATLLLALGLGSKEPGQQALSVDALITSHREGRLDTAALAGELRALSATPLVKAARYARSLQAALRLEPALHPLAFSLLSEMVQATPDAPQKDIATLLELMLELVLGYGQALPASTRQALQSMRATGKAKAAVKALLADADAQHLIVASALRPSSHAPST
jgi:hypothetical protein